MIFINMPDSVGVPIPVLQPVVRFEVFSLLAEGTECWE
jgi:hypothetical protein